MILSMSALSLHPKISDSHKIAGLTLSNCEQENSTTRLVSCLAKVVKDFKILENFDFRSLRCDYIRQAVALEGAVS